MGIIVPAGLVREPRLYRSQRHTDRPAVPKRLVAVWTALAFNILPLFGDQQMLIPIPRVPGQLLTQGALVLALFLALTVNPRVVLRPNIFLVLLTIAAIVALIVSIHNDFIFGSTYRALRFLLFISVLWLLTPWWGHRDMALLRCHRTFLWFALGSVILGAVIAPGTAFAFDGRLSGVIWPIWPTHVAHFAAVILGTSVVLWMCRLTTARYTLVVSAISGWALISTHTRTAVLALLVGFLVAGASLFLGHVRVRRVSVLGAGAATVLTAIFASQVMGWMMRGQSTEEAGQLTGRTKVWSAVANAERPRINDLFGSGMSDQSFNGLPIDSSWVATFYDQGWFGVVLQSVVILSLLLMAATRPRGPQRAVALFLIAYCMVASVTETGLGLPSAYLLDLAVAAALLAPAPSRGRS